MKSEIHIVLVWEKGLKKFDAILYDLKNSFEILDVFKINWSKDFFSNNLSRFYGQSLPSRSFKEKHCGKGAFKVVIIRQNNPQYEKRKTSKGHSFVNSVLFDKKNLYRNWTGGGHKVHTSNNVEEARHNFFFLFNKDIQLYLKSGPWSGKINNLDNDIKGCNGWIDFDELFNFVNRSSNYLILRNYSNIESAKSDYSDIDFLTSDRDFIYHINGSKKHIQNDRVACEIKIGDKFYNSDIRFYDDGYYDSNWAKSMLANKVMFQGKFFIPDCLNEFYSLLYHALIHKNTLSDKYNKRLLKLSLELGFNFEPSVFRNRKKSISILNVFLNQNQYKITRPKDFSVQYSYGNKGLKRYLWEMIGRMKNG